MWFAGPAAKVPAAGGPRVLRLGFDLKPGMRVGLFGGSFNPAHEGHAHVAETALRRLRLDRVIWLVSPQNPLEPTDETEAAPRPAETRRNAPAAPPPPPRRVWNALRYAQGPAMIVSDAETAIGSRYTIDTLRVLKARYPGVCFVWIMGADSLATFHRWRGWTQIMREAPVAVVSRPWTALKSRTSPAARRLAPARVPPPAPPAPPWRQPP